MPFSAHCASVCFANDLISLRNRLFYGFPKSPQSSRTHWEPSKSLGGGHLGTLRPVRAMVNFSSDHSGYATQDINNSSTQSGIGHTVAIVVCHLW